MVLFFADAKIKPNYPKKQIAPSLTLSKSGAITRNLQRKAFSVHWVNTTLEPNYRNEGSFFPSG